MKEQLASLLRHAFTALAGLGGFLFSKGLIDQADVVQVNGAGVSMGAALVVILTAIIGRLVLTLMGKFFRSGSGDTASGNGSGGSFPVILLLCMGIGFMGCFLSSCTAAQLSAARAFPIRIGIQSDDAALTYSTKAGLQVNAVIRPEK